MAARPGRTCPTWRPTRASGTSPTSSSRPAGSTGPCSGSSWTATPRTRRPTARATWEKRPVLRRDHGTARVKAGVLPLSRNADLSPKARDLAAQLRKRWNVDFDDASAIGRRYRRQDEIGTPFCVTVDFETLDDQ